MVWMSLVRIKSIPAKILYRLLAWNDYLAYARRLSSFRRVADRLNRIQTDGSLLIVSGRGMNVLWAQIWTAVSLSIRVRGYWGLVLTTRPQRWLNRYYKLLGLELIYLDEWAKSVPKTIPTEIRPAVDAARNLPDFRLIHYRDAPVGEIALSTYSRHHGTGLIGLDDPNVRKIVRDWIGLICQSMQIADQIYKRYKVRILFFTEVFMEEYGAFYYVALSRKLNIIRFAGTVRDDAIIVQHLSRTNDRVHHASLSPSSWGRVKKLPFTQEIDAALNENFLHRYGEKWHRSKRNHPNTKILSVEQARQILGIAAGRKVAVIYSHILYDTLFFFGTDLFKDYAEWLVESVRVAGTNQRLDWLIKVHPSNLWRGEMDSLLKGKYEEERLLERALGTLPPHVRIVPASTCINPYSWFQLADFGITVRGTSGLEMAALSKTVITAGTGRYEKNGFTVDPQDRQAYLELLAKLPDVPAPEAEQIELAKRYAYAIFVLKPFTLESLTPRLKTGKREVRASDDIIYTPKEFEEYELPPDLRRFSEWALQVDNADLLADWAA